LFAADWDCSASRRPRRGHHRLVGRHLLHPGKVISATIGLRATPEEEELGLDFTQHAEAAYSFGDLGSMGRIG